MYIGLRVKYRYSCQILMKLEFFWQIVVKSSNVKFNENPSFDSVDVECGQTDRQTDMTKLVVAFRKFTNAPENHLPSPT